MSTPTPVEQMTAEEMDREFMDIMANGSPKEKALMAELIAIELRRLGGCNATAEKFYSRSV